MNNTSAYANILLKSPVPASAAAVSKRDYQNDDSSVDFHQTLKDVNDGLKSRDERIQQSADNKKSQQFDRQRDLKEKALKESNLKESKNAKEAKEIRSANESSYVKRNVSGDKAHARESSVDKKNSVSKLADEQTRDELNPEAVNPEAVNPDAKVTLPPQDATLVAMSVVTPETASDISTETEADSTNPLLAASATTLDQNLANLPAQALAENVNATSNQPMNPAAPADAQILAASLAPVKPLESQVAVGDVSEEAAEVLAALATSTASPSKSAQTNPSAALADANTATDDPETTTAQAQMQASKSAFEKALQTMVNPESGAADDIAAPASNSSNSSNTSSSAHQLMDSFMRATETPAARSFVVQTAVPVPVGQPQWSQAVGEKVLWLAAQNVSSAEINLHPKDLGPMQVKVSVNQEQATVSFTSQHAVVREVLDQNLNRLREMFSEQGLNLVNVDVSDKSFSRQQGDAPDQKGQGGAQSLVHEEETPIAMSAIVQQRLVDHYA